jgi:hypothetical protein
MDYCVQNYLGSKKHSNEGFFRLSIHKCTIYHEYPFIRKGKLI